MFHAATQQLAAGCRDAQLGLLPTTANIKHYVVLKVAGIIFED
jgi:hypothetical protein